MTCVMTLLVLASSKLNPRLIKISVANKIADGVLIGNRRLYYKVLFNL